MWSQMKWWDGPVRGSLQLASSILCSACYFFFYNGSRGRRHPTMFEEFQSGSPSDFTVLVSVGMMLLIGYSIAWFIVDKR